ncbi:hypothetical protein C8R44DRAFT_846492 [Mycena epipterygia]|nr:hypothetical protein C8R44DRAFT_846492 [Mycena epipterygia]
MYNLEARTGALFPRDNPSLSNECWASNDAASATCCAHFNATRVTVKGSKIQACTYHGSGWDTCVDAQTGGNVQSQCSSSSAPRRMIMNLKGGGMVIVELLFGQVISGFVLS